MLAIIAMGRLSIRMLTNLSPKPNTEPNPSPERAIIAMRRLSMRMDTKRVKKNHRMVTWWGVITR